MYGVIKWVAVNLTAVLDREVSEATETVVAFVSSSDASEEPVCVLTVEDGSDEALSCILASFCKRGLAMHD
jgi:hypothetical protein